MEANFPTYMKKTVNISFILHAQQTLPFSVYANGRNDGKDTHGSVYVTLVSDDQLK